MRLVLVRISGPVLLSLMTKGVETHVQCVEGLPEGAQCIGIRTTEYTNGRTDQVDLLVQHPSFEEIPEMGTIPYYPDPIFTKVLR